MELLPFEFASCAEKAGITSQEIQNWVGKELASSKAAAGEDLSWRDLPDFQDLKENLELLKSGQTSLQLHKIARREIYQSYFLFSESELHPISLLGTTTNQTIRFEAFPDFDSLVKFAAGSFLDFPALPVEIHSLRQMNPSEFLVLGLLVELFIRTYPEPDPAWEPDRILTFSPKELLVLSQTALDQEPDGTWWAHFQHLQKIEPISLQAIESGIAMLSNKNLIGADEEQEDRFFLGKELTWFVRSLAWWDRGFEMVDTGSDTRFIFLQATGLFFITVEKGLHYGISNVSGKDVPDWIRKYLELSLSRKKEKPSPSTESRREAPQFCQYCGAKLVPNAKFCMNCGEKVQ
jgi:ribosomal protein L40E